MKQSESTRRSNLAALAVIGCFLPSRGLATTPPKPPPATSLSVSSKREHVLKFAGLLRDGAPRRMSAAALALAGLPVTTLRTSFKDENPAQFGGVSLAQIARRFAAPEVTRIRVIAVNKYEQTLPLRAWRGPDVLLAFTQDGRSMAPSARGTFRLVMDVAGLSDSRREALYPFFVWSVETLEFLR